MNMNLTLKIWRQKDAKSKGQMVEYKVTNIFENFGYSQQTPKKKRRRACSF